NSRAARLPEDVPMRCMSHGPRQPDNLISRSFPMARPDVHQCTGGMPPCEVAAAHVLRGGAARREYQEGAVHRPVGALLARPGGTPRAPGCRIPHVDLSSMRRNGLFPIVGRLDGA